MLILDDKNLKSLSMILENVDLKKLSKRQKVQYIRLTRIVDKESSNSITTKQLNKMLWG